MPYIVERKNILINQYFAAASASTTRDIQLSFIPDEVIVKYAGCYITTGAATPPLYGFQTDLISENNGYIYYQRNMTNVIENTLVNLTYSLQRPINGTFTFRLVDLTTPIVSPAITGDMVLHLEFIKYSKYGKGK